MASWSERLERARPHLVLLPAAVLAAIAVAEIVCVARAGSDVPSEADWQAASAALRERHQSGDLVVVAPGWLDPVLREHAGDLVGLGGAARMDDARYAVVWELSARGERAPETRGRERLETERFGDLTLSKWRSNPPRILTDFVAAAGGAQLEGAGNGGRRAGGAALVAASPGARPAAAALTAASIAALLRARSLVSLEEVGFAPRRCVKVVPRPDQTVRVRFPAAALGSELVGYVGLADVFTRRDVREPGRLVVAVDGREVATAIAGVEDGWVRFAAATEPGTAAVEFRATAVGPKARDRRICFAAEAREPAP